MVLTNGCVVILHRHVVVSNGRVVVSDRCVLVSDRCVEAAKDAVVTANRRDQAAADSVKGFVRIHRCFHRLEENIGRSGEGV